MPPTAVPRHSAKTAALLPPGRPSESRRRLRWPWFAVILGLAGGVTAGLAVGSSLLQVDQSNRALRWVPTVQRGIAEWAPGVAYDLAVSAVLIASVGVAWRLLRRRPRRLRAQVLGVCAAVIRVPVGQVQLSGARWRRGKQRALVRARVRYRPAEAVLGDQSVALGEALVPFVGAPVTVSWQRQRSQFVITPKPSVPLRLEQRYPQTMGKLAETLAHIVGSLEVDQRLSQVSDDGSVQKLVGRYAHTTRDIGDGFRQRVQTVLDAKAPSPSGYWTVRWEPEVNQLTVRPSAPLPTLATYPLDLPGERDQMLIPLGVGDGGRVVHWTPDRFPHLLVVGPTGTGKTIFLFSLIVSCLARGWIVCLIDPKELSFRGFDPNSLRGRGLPEWGGVVTVATTEEQMEEAIAFFHDNMRNRYAAIKMFEVSEDELPPVLMIVDEAGELVERLTEYHTSEAKLQDLHARAEAQGLDPDGVVKPKGTKNPELRKIWSGLRLGRQGRDFVVTATQRPDVSFIPGEARSNLTTRVGLGHLDGAALEMVFNTRAIQQRVFDTSIDSTGQRRRTRVRGRATVDVGDGPQTIQTFWVPDPANAILGKLSDADQAAIEGMHELVEQSRPRWAHQQEAPPMSGRAQRSASREFDRELTASDVHATEGEVGVQDQSTPALFTETTVRARELEVGDTALLEVDGTHTLVEVQEIEPDPDDADDLQITYQISGDGATAGELGVTSLDPAELIVVPA